MAQIHRRRTRAPASDLGTASALWTASVGSWLVARIVQSCWQTAFIHACPACNLSRVDWSDTLLESNKRCRVSGGCSRLSRLRPRLRRRGARTVLRVCRTVFSKRSSMTVRRTASYSLLVLRSATARRSLTDDDNNMFTEYQQHSWTPLRLFSLSIKC